MTQSEVIKAVSTGFAARTIPAAVPVYVTRLLWRDESVAVSPSLLVIVVREMGQRSGRFGRNPLLIDRRFYT